VPPGAFRGEYAVPAARCPAGRELPRRAQPAPIRGENGYEVCCCTERSRPPGKGAKALWRDGLLCVSEASAGSRVTRRDASTIFWAQTPRPTVKPRSGGIQARLFLWPENAVPAYSCSRPDSLSDSLSSRAENSSGIGSLRTF